MGGGGGAGGRGGYSTRYATCSHSRAWGSTGGGGGVLGGYVTPLH